MKPAEPFALVVTDMDGVITRTAELHEQAWRAMFDDFFTGRAGRAGEDLSPFTDHDYLEHLDGKPRLAGVRDLLRARGIALVDGEADDGPDRDTVRGLGARKNAVFLAILEERGVAVFDDTIRACDRWQRGGLPLVAISSSRNCRQVLSAVGQLDRFDAVIGGEEAATRGLAGKPDMIRAALADLAVPAARAVLLEDARNGVAAGREVGCGLVVGVDRGGQDEALREAGAHVVVQDLGRLRFPRRLPDAWERREELLGAGAGGRRSLCIFLDFDGTLSPLVDDPASARMPVAARRAVAALAGRHTVAVVSGRDLADVTGRIGLDGLFYAGSHGLEIAGPDRAMVHPEAAAAADHVAAAAASLDAALAGVTGALVERKRFSVAAHYRQVAPAAVADVRRRIDAVVAASRSLVARPGKMVLELVPAVAWDKGRAVDWLLAALAVDPQETLVLYLGDDETDEDAFAALSGRGLGIHVGPAVSDSLAAYRLAEPASVHVFLEWLAGI